MIICKCHVHENRGLFVPFEMHMPETLKQQPAHKQSNIKLVSKLVSKLIT